MRPAKKTKGCEQPKKLKGTPRECTPEQIRKCHGEAAKHPCLRKKQAVSGRRTLY